MLGFDRVIRMYYAPQGVYDEIRDQDVSWVPAWVWVSILATVAAFIMAPINAELLELNPQNLPADELDTIVENTEKWGWIQYVITPGLILLVSVIFAGISYVAVAMATQLANFKKWFVMTMYSSVISTVAVLFGAIMVRSRGESIRGPEDAAFSLSLSFLAPDANPFVHGFLQSLEFFSIWAMVVLAIGLMRVFSMSLNKAILCIIPVYLISLVSLVIGAALGALG